MSVVSANLPKGRSAVRDRMAEPTPEVALRGLLSREMRRISVPIIIDDVRKNPEFPIVRCTFFTIENDMLSPDWKMTLSNHRVSFHLLGLSGVIWKPIRGVTFSDPSQIEELFGIVERDPELHIGINDIWFPDWLFDEHIKRGEVCRVSENLFRMGYLFRGDRISKEEFLRYCHKFRDNLRLSITETESFRKWSSMQIEHAKETYPKNRGLALKWLENERPGTQREGNKE